MDLDTLVNETGPTEVQDHMRHLESLVKTLEAENDKLKSEIIKLKSRK
jgi:hypothetical protein